MTEPLTPADCDLRDFAFMPLDAHRLLDSDLFALSTGDEFKAALALWCKAWQQIPAASLPDDDRVLAHLSGAGSKWKKVKEMALRGFIKCSDGRLYHSVIAEKANDAWSKKQSYRERSKKGNAKRWGSQKDDEEASLKDPSGIAEGVLEPPKGEGEGQREKEEEGSEAKASGELPFAGPAPVDPLKVMFDSGIRLLGEDGHDVAKARQMLGKWRQAHGPEAVIVALGKAQREGAIDKISFITGCLNGGRNGGTVRNGGGDRTLAALASVLDDLGRGADVGNGRGGDAEGPRLAARGAH